MSRKVTLIIFSVAAGVTAALFHSSLDLTPSVDKAPTVLAVFMAALFVRLARGVPPFPLEKIPHANSKLILEAVSHLRVLYGQAFASFLAALIGSIAYSALSEEIKSSDYGYIATGIEVILLSWALSTSYLIYCTDISLFKAQTQAMHTIVDDIATNGAKMTVKNVRESFSDYEKQIRD